MQRMGRIASYGMRGRGFDRGEQKQRREYAAEGVGVVPDGSAAEEDRGGG